MGRDRSGRLGPGFLFGFLTKLSASSRRWPSPRPRKPLMRSTHCLIRSASWRRMVRCCAPIPLFAPPSGTGSGRAARPGAGRRRRPFRNGERRFDAPAPDGRRFEWIERLLPDGARIAIARDITRHASAADDALRAKTTLFATLTHELRTPLNGILGMAGLLEQGQARSQCARLCRRHQAIGRTAARSHHRNPRLFAARSRPRRLWSSRRSIPKRRCKSVAELLSPKARDKGLEIAVVGARRSARARHRR